MFQVVPIGLALSLTPYLIQAMGKDQWAKYSAGISLIFLSNYFSFGIGPTLNRRVSEWIGQNRPEKIPGEMKDCIRMSYFLGLVFFLILQGAILLVMYSGKLSLLQSKDDYVFFALTGVVFLLVFCAIPFRSMLESLSDFYFLALARALTAGMFFILPALYLLAEKGTLIHMALGFLVFYVFNYIVFAFRVYRKSKMLGISQTHPLKLYKEEGRFLAEKPFMRESFFFSVFFLTSAIVLFFDRFYYALFYDTQILADQVTLLDLFNRVAILTGTLSLVYFSAISVWYQEEKLAKARKNIRIQMGAVALIFSCIMIGSVIFINDLLAWWLKSSYSAFVEQNSIRLLLGVLTVNFTILLIRPLQAVGEIRSVGIILTFSTALYLFLVIIFGYTRQIEFHYIALTAKAVLDILFLGMLMKRKGII